MNKDVIILAQNKLSEFFNNYNGRPVVRISITDFDTDKNLFVEPDNKIIDALCLSFCDVTLDLVNNNTKFEIFKDHVFTVSQAQRIIKFIRKYIKHIFVINCVAGVSRSAAIAKIVCEMKGENSSWICPPHYTPNPYVYGLLHKLK